MSEILHGVLNMPPDLWDGGPIDRIQRHYRYIEASKRIKELERVLTEIANIACFECNELNIRNYTEEEVESLNEAMIKIFNLSNKTVPLGSGNTFIDQLKELPKTGIKGFKVKRNMEFELNIFRGAFELKVKGIPVKFRLEQPLNIGDFRIDLEKLCRDIMMKEDENLLAGGLDLKNALMEYFEPI